MTLYHISRISSVLDAQFTGLIDMSDQVKKSKESQRDTFLSRALAALCIKAHAGVDVAIAASAVVDGFDDGGIDAILFDQVNDVLYFVQSKWNNNGSSAMDGNEANKFVSGIRDILANKFDDFNNRIKSKQPEILSALRATRDVRIAIITAHTAFQEITPYAKKSIDRLLSDLNMPSRPPDAEAMHFNQEKIYGLITSLSKPPKIDIPITLSFWGQIDTPFEAYYGRANIAEVAGWWKLHGKALCDRNIRSFFHRSDVNDALKSTLKSNQEYFWYFNNGITIICDSVKKSLVGIPRREIGLFNCKGVSVVNGAQTVGVIGSTADLIDLDADVSKEGAFDQSFVHVRIISLEKCPPEFDRLITDSTNLQNAVEYRDFAAMDPIQHGLAMGFALENRRYVYKRGEEDPHGEEGCSITEATQALGCAESMDVAVQVKRSIGEIWRRIKEPPYTTLFNKHLTSSQVWRAVLVLRAVDEELQKHAGSLVAVHLNRALLNIVFQDPCIRLFKNESSNSNEIVAKARIVINDIFHRAGEYLDEHHAKEYLGNFCKNAVKCKELSAALSVIKKEPTEYEIPDDLFGGLDKWQRN
jgi:hypothetical protein